MTRKEVIQTEAMLSRLTGVLSEHRLCTCDAGGSAGCAKHDMAADDTREDAESLRRISMTLHRWHELECGNENGAIERDETTGKPYWRPANNLANAHLSDSQMLRHKQWPVPDREAGALKRLAAIMSRYPSLSSYVQGDPRGCALYILRPGDVPTGKDVGAYYSRGLVVHQ